MDEASSLQKQNDVRFLLVYRSVEFESNISPISEEVNLGVGVSRHLCHVVSNFIACRCRPLSSHAGGVARLHSTYF